MGRLVCYELKKLWGQRLAVVLSLLLLLFNCLITQRSLNSETYGVSMVTVAQTYASLETTEPSAALAEIEKRLEPLNAFMMDADYRVVGYWEKQAEIQCLLQVRKEISDLPDYPAYLDSLQRDIALKLRTSLFAPPGSFDYQTLQRSQKIYGRLPPVSLPAVDDGAVQITAHNPTTDGVILLYLLLLGLLTATRERETGILTLLHPCWRGGSTTYGAKILSFLLSAVLGCFLFLGSNLLLARIYLGELPLMVPLQAMEGYIDCPYELTVGWYLFLFFLLKTAAFCISGLFLLLLCALARDSVSACCYVVIAVVLFYLQNTLTGAMGQFSLWRLLDIPAFFTAYWDRAVFGRAVSAAALSVCSAVLCGAGSILVLLWLGKQPILQDRKGRKLLRPDLPHLHLSLFWQEGRKLLLTHRALLLIILMFFLGTEALQAKAPQKTMGEYYYSNYAELLSGKPSSEKETFLAQEAERYSRIENQLLDLEERLIGGKVSGEDYQLQEQSLRMQLLPQEAFSQAKTQYDYVVGLKDSRAGFVNDLGYRRLLGEEGAYSRWKSLALTTLFLLLGLSPVFAYEKETGVETLLCACGEGKKKSSRYKLLWALLFAAVCYFLAFLPELLLIKRFYSLPGLTLSAQSLPLLAEVPAFLPLWGYLILRYLLWLFAAIAIAGGVLWLSKRLGKTTSTL